MSVYRDTQYMPDKVIDACRTFMKGYHEAPVWKRVFWEWSGKYPPAMLQSLRIMAEWYVQHEESS